eukprot:4007212-Amphidinium_carterae.1
MDLVQDLRPVTRGRPATQEAALRCRAGGCEGVDGLWLLELAERRGCHGDLPWSSVLPRSVSRCVFAHPLLKLGRVPGCARLGTKQQFLVV